jgi:hypothetical protein
MINNTPRMVPLQRLNIIMSSLHEGDNGTVTTDRKEW